VSLGDSIRNFFARKRNPNLGELEAFLQTHRGIEGYVEPRTATQPTTLLLVDREGDNVRAAVRDPEDAAAFCRQQGIPVYDAAVMGYPQRMVDFERGRGSDMSALDARIAEMERQLRDPGPNEPS
jgi:hypothetical protein